MLTRKQVLAAKIETTPGTAEALTAAEAAFDVFSADIQPDIEYQNRQGSAVFSPLPGDLGARAEQKGP